MQSEQNPIFSNGEINVNLSKCLSDNSISSAKSITIIACMLISYYGICTHWKLTQGFNPRSLFTESLHLANVYMCL